MPLTDRATKYLKKQKRDWAWHADKVTTTLYLTSCGLPSFEALLDFQSSYSGYYLANETKVSDGFSLKLFSKKHLLMLRGIDCEKIGGHYYFPCGEHKSAQFNFALCDNGNLCINDEPIQVIKSSIEILIEQYALSDEYEDWFELPYYYHLERADLLESYIQTKSHYKLILECSDEFNQWLMSDTCILVKAIWWGDEGFSIHIFGRTEKDARLLAEELHHEGITE